MTESRRPPSMVTLMLLIGIPPFATDTYLAAMPAMGATLGASAATIQLTLTAFLLGVAAGQLIVGPISDGTGRRPFLLAGTITFIVLSGFCAVAPNGPLLVAGRLVQGFAAAAGIVCGRAVISDYFPADRAVRRFAIVTSAGLVAPVVAPMLGGVILGQAGWRAIFFFLGALGVVMLAGVVLRVPETLPPQRRHPRNLTASLGRMAALLRDRIFRGHLITSCLAMAGFFTYIAGSSFVLQDVYGISEATYTVIFAVNALSMVASSITFTALVNRVEVTRLRAIGLCATVTASVSLLLVGFSGVDGVIWASVPLCVLTAGMGFVLPASIALVQNAGRHYAGTASALQGGAQMLCGALVSPLTGLIGTSSLLGMAVVMAGFMVASIIASRCLARPAAPQPADEAPVQAASRP
ncbi:MAG: multidrug effflux MFS transporter [Kibdelosporangium sp.]